jgi:hypothetical protein
MSIRVQLSVVILVLGLMAGTAFSQSSSTGAISGTVHDASGAVVPGATITAINVATGGKRSTTSQANGDFTLPVLPPGSYRVEVTEKGFKTWNGQGISVVVSETVKVNVGLQIGATSETVDVEGAGAQIQTESAELGRVTGSQQIEDLPLVSRNYLQIIGLNPGVSAEITNATDLGRGSTSLAAAGGGFSAGGSNTSDNNFQMNGVEVNDNFGAADFTGGLPVPNPDTLQEFKVVTGQYDAANGRNGGAVVDVLTKTGTNDLHGSLFEFLRNDDLNANEWFNKMNGQPRQVLKQNQFGGTIGGHIIKDKLLYFGSYQGTRQRNGVSAGCADEVFLPPLTNDRSAAALGAIFAGQRGYVQDLLGGVGPAIAADGSNINPVALKLLQMKGPNGGYLIPTPQTINPNAPFDTEGSASFSVPCPFTEDQYIANVDWLQSDKSRLQARTFFANSTATQTLPSPNTSGSAVPGFPYYTTANFRNVSLTHTYTFSPTLVNQAVLGYNRSQAGKIQGELFSWSDIGSTVPSFVNAMPGIGISGVGLGGYGQSAPFVQNTFVFEDYIAWTHGRHNLRFGGGVTRNQTNESYFDYFGAGVYLTFADFLLGLDGTDNGTAAAGLPASNEYLDLALPGDLARYYRYWDRNLYVQDDIKVTQRLTVNLGLRYEHLGDFSEAGGKNTGLNLAALDPNPPAGGTLNGYVVPSNYPGTVPAGVTKSDNEYGIAGKGQDAFEPRVGFAWQIPGTERVVLRGGYGMFHSRYTGNGLIQSLTAQPWASVVLNELTQNAGASLQNPIPQTIPTFPSWTGYTPSTDATFQGPSQNYQPSVWQRFSLDTQVQLAKDMVWDIGYVGGRGTKLYQSLFVNQADLASAADPIRGETTNTVANIPLRVPYEGWSPQGLLLNVPGGESWYNALQTSLDVRFKHGLTALVAYTWARDLSDTQGGVVGGGFGGSVYGNQFTPRQTNYGPEAFIRPQRLVISYAYELPHPANFHSLKGAVLGGWTVSGVTTWQSGHPLTAVASDPTNVYGVPYDRPDYNSGCSVNKGSSVQSTFNSGYFNTSCFALPPTITADGGTGFGDAPIGNIAGPGETDFDFAILKYIPVRFPNEKAQFEFRTEFFNLFNHPIFNDPSTAIGPGSNFGQVSGPTIVGPRVIQFALEYKF